jgi:hypothetical protein
VTGGGTSDIGRSLNFGQLRCYLLKFDLLAVRAARAGTQAGTALLALRVLCGFYCPHLPTPGEKPGPCFLILSPVEGVRGLLSHPTPRIAL